MPRDLSMDEAYREAVKRWGKTARVEKAPPMKPAEVERCKNSIRTEQEKIEARSLPDGERCLFVDDKGRRCVSRRDHEKPREVTIVGFRATAVSSSKHSCRGSLAERIAREEQTWITDQLNGWAKVGKLAMGGMFFTIEGEGPTFREAFAKYDAKKALEQAETDKRAALRRKQLASLAKARAAKAAKKNNLPLISVEA